MENRNVRVEMYGSFLMRRECPFFSDTQINTIISPYLDFLSTKYRNSKVYIHFESIIYFAVWYSHNEKIGSAKMPSEKL